MLRAAVTAAIPLFNRETERTTEFPEVIGNTLDYETSGRKMKGPFDADTRQLHI